MFKKLFTALRVPLIGAAGGGISALIAKKKGKDPLKWFGIGAIVSIFLVWIGLKIKEEVDKKKGEENGKSIS